MGKLDIDVDEVKKLVDLVEKYHLEELTVEHGDMAVTVKGKSLRPSPQTLPSPQDMTIAPAEPETIEPEIIEQPEAIEGNIVDIVAPLVGVFYRSPAPDEPPFVEVGDIIEVGSRVGLLEAMKVFNEVPSEVAGEVVEIPAENGKLVREGDTLVRVRVEE
ncbi:MAG: acetyl-CoA carboxylase biotin carboxyl carrier protein [Armatimonadota bacterium]